MENCGATGALLLLLLPAAGGAANMEPAGGAGGYAEVNGLIAFILLLLALLFGTGSVLLSLFTGTENIFAGSAFPADVADEQAFWG